MRNILFILLFTVPISAWAQGSEPLSVDVKGFVDTYHALRSESDYDWMSSRSRVRGELTLSKGGAGAFVSTNMVYNSILKERSGLQIREAYTWWGNERWDIRAGRQIITWGVADGLRVTDIISPMDYTEFLAQDYDDIRIPVGGLRLRYLRDRWNLEVVAVPVASFFELPVETNNPWSVVPTGLPMPVEASMGTTPAHKLENMEYGARFSTFLNGIDFSLCALQTWNKMPVFTSEVQAGAILMTGQYRRMTMIGADVSLPVGQFVIRGEGAQYFDEAQTPATGTNIPRSGTANALLGIDWYAGNDWNLSAQYSYKYIEDYNSSMSGNQHTHMGTFRISKSLLNNTLSLQSFAYMDLTDGGIYNRFSADYALNDQIHLMLGYDLFHADKGMFQMYAHNSEYWLKLKYNF
jgi:hypothetical protein